MFLESILDQSPMSPRLKTERGSSPLKQLRVMANFEPDLNIIKNSLNSLQADFQITTELAKKFNDNFDRFTEMILDLEENFKQVTDPLMKFIMKDHQNNLSSDVSSDDGLNDSLTRTISINNLNEFICENVLSEYLRQNNIFVAKCIRTLGYNERSRNFHVTCRQSDLDKLLAPDLWPKGVTLSVRGDYKTASIHGKREKNLPGVVISSGMSYWHS